MKSGSHDRINPVFAAVMAGDADAAIRVIICMLSYDNFKCGVTALFEIACAQHFIS